MRPIGPRLIAAVSVFVSAAAGLLANVVTSHWSWTAAAALATLVVVAAALAWWDRRVPSQPAAGIVQVARRGGRIDGAVVRTHNLATIEQTADHDATITNSRLTANGAPIRQHVDRATINDAQLTTDP